jgi:hypothetical protein
MAMFPFPENKKGRDLGHGLSAGKNTSKKAVEIEQALHGFQFSYRWLNVSSGQTPPVSCATTSSFLLKRFCSYPSLTILQQEASSASC